MATTSRDIAGSASTQGELWGARARDWVEAQEHLTDPLNESVLRTLELGPGDSILDAGCGAGGFALAAAGRGAAVTGLDAAPAFVAIARERVPSGDFRVGELEDLPYDDGSFDAVIGLNSFQYAASPVNALREARRVVRTGHPVVIATWGRADDCETAVVLRGIGSLLPPPPPGTPGPFALSEDGALARLLGEAGLTLQSTEDVDCPFVYGDLDVALRAVLSSGPAAKAIQTAGEARVREVVAEALEPYRSASGAYRLENVFRYAVATA
jgi:SAM-dependent methyltransferase